MPATRSTTKHQRQTQNSRRSAIQQGRRDFSRCERCGGIFSLYRGSAKRHEDACKRQEEQQRLSNTQVQAVQRTPTPLPPSPFASSLEIESESEAGMDTVMDNLGRFFPLCHCILIIFERSIDDFLASPPWDVDSEFQQQSWDDSHTASPPPQGNSLILDPFLETTPPPDNIHDEFGMGMTPDWGLDTLQSGQTLVIYQSSL